MRIIQFGVGRWGENHARILSHFSNVNPNVESITTASVLDWEGYVRDLGDYDAAVITAPSDAHFNLLRWCFTKRVPVYCEKPICLTSQELAALHAAWLSAGEPIFMAGHQMTFAYDALPFSSIRTFHSLRSGAIPRSEGALLSLAVHDLAVVQHLVKADAIIVKSVLGDKHSCLAEFSAMRNGERVIEHASLFAQSVAPSKLRHSSITGVTAAGTISTCQFEPDNWARQDLLKLALSEFVSCAFEGTHPKHASWTDTRVVMRALLEANERLSQCT